MITRDFNIKGIAYYIFKYREHYGIKGDEISDWHLAEHFYNVYKIEYAEGGDTFIRVYLDNKFIEGKGEDIVIDKSLAKKPIEWKDRIVWLLLAIGCAFSALCVIYTILGVGRWICGILFGTV